MIEFRAETLVHRVIIKPKIETTTKSGIVISTSERSQAINSDQGEIFLIGPKAWSDFGCDTPPVNVGDRVFYAKYGAKVLKDPDTNELYIICNDEDVLVGYTENE
jgi:co-chaperonin GroES (HSP10)